MRPLGTEEQGWDVQPEIGHNSAFHRRKGESERMKTSGLMNELKKVIRNRFICIKYFMCFISEQFEYFVIPAF